MHTDATEAGNLMQALAEWADAHGGPVQMIVAPPFPFLAAAVERARKARAGKGGAALMVAAQNCHQEAHGAYTGEVSVPMLRSLGVQACIVGHSERRAHYGETDEAVGHKIAMLLEHGLLPVYCCGERRDEREAGRHRDVVATQLHSALAMLPPADVARIVVAYEPVWAIGTGLTATPAQAQEMHAFIREELRAIAGEEAAAIPLLYGGSCKPDNAAGLFAQPDINGGLIGGASLEAAQFLEIVRIAARKKHPA